MSHSSSSFWYSTHLPLFRAARQKYTFFFSHWCFPIHSWWPGLRSLSGFGNQAAHGPCNLVITTFIWSPVSTDWPAWTNCRLFPNPAILAITSSSYNGHQDKNQAAKQVTNSVCGTVVTWKEELGQEVAPIENSQGEFAQAEIGGILKTTAIRHVRSHRMGSPGSGATWLFILLHSEFEASFLNTLPRLVNHVSRCTPSNFKIIMNYSTLVVSILALPRVFCALSMAKIQSNPQKAAAITDGGKKKKLDASGKASFEVGLLRRSYTECFSADSLSWGLHKGTLRK